MKHTKVLTIAGFDGSGGAGLQADHLTFAALGCYGMSVVTAIAVQNTMGVSNCYPIPIRAIEEQLEAIFTDLSPDVIKIGMLFNKEIMETIANYLKDTSIPIVLDPVMVAKSGHVLLNPNAIQAMKEQLFPLATLITPNIPEATVLTGIPILDKHTMYQAASVLQSYGVSAVLLKGGHLEGTSAEDLLLTDHLYWFHAPRIDTQNTHGTGCTLSSAIAASLAQGYDLQQACYRAKHYLTQALLAHKNIKIGQGHGPVHHFFNLTECHNV